jgi:two-component system cell cycle response regulator
MTGLVLVVDDVPANVKLLEAKLTNEYYDVITAKDGYEAIEQTKSRMPDLILLDVMMPGMDGFETCRQLKQDPDVAHIPVVMVTALSDPSDRVQGLEAGADDFITKPINDTSLFARVRSLVRIKVLIDELRLRDQSGAQLGAITDKFSLNMDISGSKVMVIDDDVIQSRRINEKLSAAGYDVDVFSEHQKALEHVKNATDIDVIIISTQLIDVDGLRLASQFKAFEAVRNVPVIMLVDEDEQHLMLKALDLGVNDYLITPIDFNEMFARVKTQVRRKLYQEALKSNYHESVSMAVTDGLTKLYNRHYLDTHMKNMVQQAQQGGRPMSVLIMDMDHFKSVNDTYGHDVGDQILVALSEIIVHIIRSADLAARFGGEEFVILMPETDEARAYEAAERVRKRVEAHAFTVNHDVGTLHKTVSIGCATIRPDDTPETLMKRADNALYEAKHGGRNRVFPVPAEGEGYALPPSRHPNYTPETMPDNPPPQPISLDIPDNTHMAEATSGAVNIHTQNADAVDDAATVENIAISPDAPVSSPFAYGVHDADKPADEDYAPNPNAIKLESAGGSKPDAVLHANAEEDGFIIPEPVPATATPELEDVVAETEIALGEVEPLLAEEMQVSGIPEPIEDNASPVDEVLQTQLHAYASDGPATLSEGAATADTQNMLSDAVEGISGYGANSDSDALPEGAMRAAPLESMGMQPLPDVPSIADDTTEEGDTDTVISSQQDHLAAERYARQASLEETEQAQAEAAQKPVAVSAKPRAPVKVIHLKKRNEDA